MQAKAADDREQDVAALEGLLKWPQVDARTRTRIEQEIRSIRVGAAGEREAAYEIEFHFGATPNVVTIHDLRIEHDGYAAQIDHLIINRVLQIWICESKHFSEGVAVNAQGEWTRYFGGHPVGMESPIKQNERQITVLDRVLKSGAVRLPRRLVQMRPELRGLVLVSNKARITRPRAKVDGIETVIKAEQLADRVYKDVDVRLRTLVQRFVSEKTIEQLARDLVALHRPTAFDWAARFGLEQQAPAPTMSTRGLPGDPSGVSCGRCGGSATFAEVAFCRYNKPRFRGGIYCRPCQAIVAPVGPRD
jgi:hypothetical protein